MEGRQEGGNEAEEETSKSACNGKKVKSSRVVTYCLKVFVFASCKLEDNIFKVVQLFMFGDVLQALSLLMQQD